MVSGRLADPGLLELARTHDITILDSPGVTAGSSEQAIEDCLLSSGHPVLIIPHAISSAKFRRVAIAWDGSAQAARAVKDAMDVLQGAELVVAVTAIGRKDLRVASGADLVRYLRATKSTASSTPLLPNTKAWAAFAPVYPG